MSVVYAKALHDPTPTSGAKSERYLAVALGYPLSWRVRRRLDEEGRIMDVVYAGNPRKGVDRWYNHEAALRAAQQFNDNPFQFKGGHMLKRQPKFQKGDYVEVKYSKKWHAATIIKRRQVNDDFRYSVHYLEDDSTQDHVSEHLIRLATPDQAALELASQLGFPEGWKATVNGTRYTITSADGSNTFRSKKAALEYLASAEVDGGDPPWRVNGHELIGKEVMLTHTHKLSGMRSVTVDQVGAVVGWISKTDTDRQGQPGYICEATGKPASLFHIQFRDEPGHAYAKYLLDFQDMEEAEVRSLLLPDDVPTKKRKR